MSSEALFNHKCCQVPLPLYTGSTKVKVTRPESLKEEVDIQLSCADQMVLVIVRVQTVRISSRLLKSLVKDKNDFL